MEIILDLVSIFHSYVLIMRYRVEIIQAGRQAGSMQTDRQSDRQTDRQTAKTQTQREIPQSQAMHKWLFVRRRMS